MAFIEKRRRILLYIAVHGPVNKGQIEKAIKPKIDHPTIHKAVKQLVSEREVEAQKTRSRIINFYGVTVRGLADVLSQPQAAMILNQLVEKHRNLIPGIFDLWPRIVKAGLTELFTERLTSACKWGVEQNKIEWAIDPTRQDHHAETFDMETKKWVRLDFQAATRILIERQFWKPELQIGVGDPWAWLKICCQDDELRSRIVSAISSELAFSLMPLNSCLSEITPKPARLTDWTREQVWRLLNEIGELQPEEKQRFAQSDASRCRYW